MSSFLHFSFPGKGGHTPSAAGDPYEPTSRPHGDASNATRDRPTSVRPREPASSQHSPGKDKPETSSTLQVCCCWCNCRSTGCCWRTRQSGDICMSHVGANTMSSMYRARMREAAAGRLRALVGRIALRSGLTKARSGCSRRGRRWQLPPKRPPVPSKASWTRWRSSSRRVSRPPYARTAQYLVHLLTFMHRSEVPEFQDGVSLVHRQGATYLEPRRR